jgi:integrase
MPSILNFKALSRKYVQLHLGHILPASSSKEISIIVQKSFYGSSKDIEDFRFHDLRHTFNTNMRKAGVDRSVIMKITGHNTMSMFERYNTVDGNDAVEAGRRLDEFIMPPAPVGKVTAILLQGPPQ